MSGSRSRGRGVLAAGVELGEAAPCRWRTRPRFPEPIEDDDHREEASSAAAVDHREEVSPVADDDRREEASPPPLPLPPRCISPASHAVGAAPTSSSLRLARELDSEAPT